MNVFGAKGRRENVRNVIASGDDATERDFLLFREFVEANEELRLLVATGGVAGDGRERVQRRGDFFRPLQGRFERRVLKEERLSRRLVRRRQKRVVRRQEVAERNQATAVLLRRVKAFAADALGDFERFVFEVAFEEEAEPTLVSLGGRDRANRDRLGRAETPVDGGRFAKENGVKVGGVARRNRAVRGQPARDVTVETAELERPSRTKTLALDDVFKGRVSGGDVAGRVMEERLQVVPTVGGATRSETATGRRFHRRVKGAERGGGGLRLPGGEQIFRDFEPERRRLERQLVRLRPKVSVAQNRVGVAVSAGGAAGVRVTAERLFDEQTIAVMERGNRRFVVTLGGFARLFGGEVKVPEFVKRDAGELVVVLTAHQERFAENAARVVVATVLNERDPEENVEPSDRPMVRRNGAFRVKVQNFFALRVERRERAQNFAATARREHCATDNFGGVDRNGALLHHRAPFFEAVLGDFVADDDRRFRRENAERNDATARAPRRRRFRDRRNAARVSNAGEPFRILQRERERGVVIFQRVVEFARLVTGFAEHRVIAKGVEPLVGSEANGVAQFLLVKERGFGEVALFDQFDAAIVTVGRNRANIGATGGTASGANRRRAGAAARRRGGLRERVGRRGGEKREDRDEGKETARARHSETPIKYFLERLFIFV